MIYNYIYNILCAPIAAERLLNYIEKSIENLRTIPKAYRVIKKYQELNREFRIIVVNNYILVYTISEKANIVYVVHLYYGKCDYLKNI